MTAHYQPTAQTLSMGHGKFPRSLGFSWALKDGQREEGGPMSAACREFPCAGSLGDKRAVHLAG